MVKGYIYRHWIINDRGIEKSYIGQVCNRELKDRWKNGGKGYTRTTKKDGTMTEFGNAIQKYGWDNFYHDVLLVIECETLDELMFWLDEWEKYYIDKYDSFYNGYNGTLGGTNGIKAGFKGKKHSDEFKKHQSELKKGKRTSSQLQQMKSVVCLNTLESFSCVSDAQKWCNVQKGVANCCNGSVKHCGLHPITKEPLRWVWKEKWDSLNEKQKEEMKQINIIGQTSPKKVICLQTLDVFNTCGEASKWCNGNVSQYFCKKTAYAGTHPTTGEKLAWAYYNDYKNMSKKEINNKIQKAKNYSLKGNNNPSAKKVICLNTMQVFETVTNACEWCGCGNGNLSSYCKNKLYLQNKTRGKHPETGEPLKWMYYDEYLKLHENK